MEEGPHSLIRRPHASSSTLVLVLILVFASPVSCLQKITYKGIVAQQSTDRFGLTLREVWDGSRLTQALSLSDGEVLACESGSRPPLDFLANATQPANLSVVPLAANLTADLLANITLGLPAEFSWLPSLKEDCRRADVQNIRAKRAAGSPERRRTRHGRKKANRRRKLKIRRKDHLAKGKTGHWKEQFITPGTKWCGPSNMARRYADVGPSFQPDRCCRTHDQCQKHILGLSRGYGRFNFNPFTVSHCSCDKSQQIPTGRRKLKPTDVALLRVPGTMWCGRGYSATTYRQLGAFVAADRCCRRHDTACPLYIPALSYRFGLYNWRPSTLMHCHCDRRFRTCLKMAGTMASNFVGKLFFNFIQTDCFVLKTERLCVQRNWWGKCQKTEMRRLAHLRPNMAF